MEYRDLLYHASANRATVTDEVAFAALKKVYSGTLPLLGEKVALEAAEKSLQLVPQIDQSLETFAEVQKTLPLFTLDQANQIALLAFQAGIDGIQDWETYYHERTADWDVPERYFPQGDFSDKATEEGLKAWWTDQDRVAHHYYALGKELRKQLTELPDPGDR